MLPPRVGAVAFDAVGTLIHPHPPGPVVYAAVGRRHGSRLTAAEVASRFRTALLAEDAADRANGLRTSEDRELRRWQAVVRAVLSDVDDPDECFRELFAHFARPAAWRLEAGSATVLEELSARGFPLALASNYDRRLRSVVTGMPELAALGHIIISSEVGWRKPAPAFFQAVCAALATAPAQTLFVGDDRGNDCEGALACGLPAVWLDRHGQAADPAPCRVGTLAELLCDPRLRAAG